MIGYSLRRLLQAVPVLFVTSVVVFTLLRLVPGDPALVLAGSDASPAQLNAVRSELGLNRSLPEQYLVYLGHLAHGDLGRSYVSRRSVGSLIKTAAPAPAQLSLAAFLLSLAIGIPFGVVAGLRPNSCWDLALAGFVAIVQGIPNFFSPRS